MIEKYSGTIQMTEESSQCLLQMLKKQDKEYLEALFNGETTLHLKSSNGKEVLLVPSRVLDDCRNELCEKCEEIHFMAGQDCDCEECRWRKEE